MTEPTKYLFTSESVTEGHPDKMADQISDAVLDEALRHDPMSRVACETMVTTGMVLLAGEITTQAYLDFAGIARKTVEKIGYTDSRLGFDASSCAVISAIDPQSPDIAMGVDPGGAGDPGIDVRLCLPRNRRAHAADDHACASPHRETGQRPQRR